MSEIVRKSGLPPYEAIQQNTKLHEALARAKSFLTVQYPYLGFITITTYFTRSEAIPTCAATTRDRDNYIFVNETFFREFLKDDPERVFILSHEIMHIYMEHVGRQVVQNYNPMLWNIATDYFNNNYLNKIAQDGTMRKPDFVLYDARFNGMSSDAIYHQLLEENNNSVEEAIKNNGGSFFQGNDLPFDGDLRDQLGDQQIPMDEVSLEQPTQGDLQENRQRLTAAVNDASQQKNIGSGSQDFLRMIKDFLDPQVHWGEELNDVVRERVKSDYTYNIPSTQSTKEIIFPSMDGEHLSVVFGCDTSGSMNNNDVQEIVSETQGIFENFESWAMHLVSCDTEAKLMGEFNSDEHDIEDIRSSGVYGAGGTELSPIVDYARTLDDEKVVCIIGTDGFIPPQEIENAIDEDDNEMTVIILVTKNGADDIEGLEQGIPSATKVIKMN